MNVPVLVWSQLSVGQRREALQRPTQRGSDELLQRVRTIIDDVRQGGDAALKRYTRDLDGADLEQLAVSACRIRGG